MSFGQYQVSDAKADLGIQAVAGSCPNTNDFLALLNTVTRRLMKRGGFWETEIILRLCVEDCYIAWPRMVGTVLGVRFCNSGQSEMRNNWWTIIGGHTCGSEWNSNVAIVDGNTVPTYNKVSGNEGKLIRYYPVHNDDIGKTITLYGKRYGGQPLEEFVSGVWRQGLTLTAASPFGTTTVLVTQIDSVVRQQSSGLMYLYEYDSASDTIRDLAMYAPSETNPRYRSSIIKNICAIPYCTDGDGRKIRKVDALVKLQFVPYQLDADFLFLDDFDSIALGMQAVKLEQANDHAGAEAKWMQSIRELNYSTRDKQPELQTAIRLNVWGDGAPVLVNPI